MYSYIYLHHILNIKTATRYDECFVCESCHLIRAKDFTKPFYSHVFIVNFFLKPPHVKSIVVPIKADFHEANNSPRIYFLHIDWLENFDFAAKYSPLGNLPLCRRLYKQVYMLPYVRTRLRI